MKTCSQPSVIAHYLYQIG